MNFKNSFNIQPTFASLTTLIGKNFPFFSFIYQLNFQSLAHIKPNLTLFFEKVKNFIALS